MVTTLAMRYIGDTVSAMLANTPEMYEAHFGVAMCGGVLNAINTRLDADTVAFILRHAEDKPTNVVFREDGSPVLIDFGLAKEAQLNAGITGVGTIFGTPYYMSPEQGEGSAVDPRSDIYSLGVVFFEMLTGNRPFSGSTALSVIIQHREVPPPRLTGELVRFQPLLDRMLAKKTDDRFRDIGELLASRPAGM